MSESLADHLAMQSRRLQPEQLREVIDFTEFLLSRPASAGSTAPPGSGASLVNYVGGVSHGSLASRIDDDLHGPPVR